MEIQVRTMAHAQSERQTEIRTSYRWVGNSEIDRRLFLDVKVSEQKSKWSNEFEFLSVWPQLGTMKYERCIPGYVKINPTSLLELSVPSRTSENCMDRWSFSYTVVVCGWELHCLNDRGTQEDFSVLQRYFAKQPVCLINLICFVSISIQLSNMCVLPSTAFQRLSNNLAKTPVNTSPNLLPKPPPQTSNKPNKNLPNNPHVPEVSSNQRWFWGGGL